MGIAIKQHHCQSVPKIINKDIHNKRSIVGHTFTNRQSQFSGKTVDSKQLSTKKYVSHQSKHHFICTLCFCYHELMKLLDAQWTAIEPLIQSPKMTTKGGRPRVDNRQVLNGILYVLLNNCQWADLPPNLGAYVTCWRRYSEWQKNGTWEKIWLTLFPLLTRKQLLEWSMALWQGSFIPYKKS